MNSIITTDDISLNNRISNFMKNYNDCMIDVKTELNDIITRIDDQFIDYENKILRFSHYVEVFELSENFKNTILNSHISDIIFSNSPVIEDLSIHQFEVFYSNYLMRKSSKGILIIEPIKLCWLRVAYTLSINIDDLIETYNALSMGKISVSSIIYKRSATTRPQMISCFLMTPTNNIHGITKTFHNSCLASKHGGAVGISLNRLRSNCTKNGLNFTGVLSWVELYSNISNVRVRDFKKGAVTLYLPFYSKDIFDFLNSINEERTLNKCTLVNKIGVYINNTFLDAIINDRDIYLFNPDDYPEIADKHGDDFAKIYFEQIANDPNSTIINAKDLMLRIVRSIIQCGGPYILNLDAMNMKSNQRKLGLIVANLCTEINEVADNGDVACCNLSQLPVHNYVKDGEIDHISMGKYTRLLVRDLNHSIDISYYPIAEEMKEYENVYDVNNIPDKTNNQKHRPIGIGISGLFSLFSILGIDYTSKESMKKFENITNKIMACIYFNAVYESCRMAYENFSGIFSEELFQFDLIKEYRQYVQNSEYLSDKFKEYSSIYDREVSIVEPSEWGQEDLYIGNILVNSWQSLQIACELYGRYNTLLTALMPTATNSLALGGTEAFDPRYSNIYNHVSGNNTIICIDKFLKKDLQANGWYTQEILSYIESNNGSIKGVTEYIQSNTWNILWNSTSMESLQRIENTYWTAHEIPHVFYDRINHILSNYVDQATSYNSYVDYNELYLNIIQRGLMGRKTIIYYYRNDSEAKQIKCDDSICINCQA